MASGSKKSNSKNRLSANRRALATASRTSSAPTKAFAVCVDNSGYKASLELRKIYEVLEDAFAKDHQLIRVVDESGEDYLYPAQFFVRLELPASLQQKLKRIA